jgi:hypothetical protein
VVDRQTGFHAVTNFSGRYIDSPRAGQAQNRLVLEGLGAALEKNELHALSQFGPAVPFVEARKLIGADEPGEPGLGESLSDFGGGVDGIGGTGPFDLATAEPKTGLALEGKAEHGEALGVGDVRIAVLEGGFGAGDEEDGVELGLLKGVMGENEMPMVNGIKSAAEDAETQAMSGTGGHGSSGFDDVGAGGEVVEGAALRIEENVEEGEQEKAEGEAENEAADERPADGGIFAVLIDDAKAHE